MQEIFSLADFKARLKHWIANVKSPSDLLMLPKLVEELTTTCPHAGQGVHYWLPKAAWILAHWPFRFSFGDICPVLEKAMLDHGRESQPDEVANAVNFVMGTACERKSKRGRRRKPATVSISKRLAKEASTKVREAEVVLKEQSGVQEPDAISAYSVLLRRFPEGSLLFFNHDQYNTNVYRLGPKFDKWFANGRWIPELMVPHIFTGQSKRRLIVNFKDWSYQITEFDKGTPNEQASKILWLKDKSIAPPLVMVVWSGGKSLHAWWDVRSLAAEQRIAFFNLAIRVGADPAHKTINQLVRTPNAIRGENNKQQKVIYLI